MKTITAFVLTFFPCFSVLFPRLISPPEFVYQTPKKRYTKRVFYGQASFYNNIFEGKKTANGEIFSQKKYTAACNLIPLGTWIKVTNLKNGKSVKVRTTDRLHTRMRRIVDLSHIAAKKLGFIKDGLTRVKIEMVLTEKQKRRH